MSINRKKCFRFFGKSLQYLRIYLQHKGKVVKFCDNTPSIVCIPFKEV